MTTTMPDRPLTQPEEDLLGRAPFANNLADLIINAPSNATLRLGVYGGWGEGKTSVLGLMHRRLAAAGHVCVWLYPWMTATEEEFLEYFVNSVADALQIDRSQLQALKTASHFADRAREAGREASSTFKIVDLLAGSSIQTAIDKYLRGQQSALQKQIAEGLNGRKLIVLVDDLDRVQPDLLPRLLLTLREVLDQPNLFYVMALAPAVVERGLASVHEGWGEASEFLDKIIEFPAYLPAPRPEALKRFIANQLEPFRTT